MIKHSEMRHRVIVTEHAEYTYYVEFNFNMYNPV